MAPIQIDMNNPAFQKCFFDLEKIEQQALIKTLKKIVFVQMGHINTLEASCQPRDAIASREVASSKIKLIKKQIK